MTLDNQKVITELERRFKKLKDVGAPEYYLGGNLKRVEDPESVLTLGAKTYIKRSLEQYEKLFDGPPKKQSAPLKPRDHPEMDASKLCGESETALYQSLIDMLQWAVTLGRSDIMAAVQCLSSFRVMPWQGQLKRRGSLRTFGTTLMDQSCSGPRFQNMQMSNTLETRTVGGTSTAI